MATDNFSNKSRRKLTYQVQFAGGYGSLTATGNVTLSERSSHFLRIDPGGAARDVTLPDVDDNNGMWFHICNTADAAEALTVKDASGSTVVVIAQNEAAVVVGSGSNGWVHMGIQTIALS